MDSFFPSGDGNTGDDEDARTAKVSTKMMMMNNKGFFETEVIASITSLLLHDAYVFDLPFSVVQIYIGHIYTYRVIDHMSLLYED